jgi:transglutaminase-like putative cysteine protease
MVCVININRQLPNYLFFLFITLNYSILMPQFVIHHVTKYNYPVPVRDSANQLMLFPVKDAYQSVQSQHISITNEPVLEMYTDYYGNEIATFTNRAPHTELRIDSNISVTTRPVPLPADDKLIEALELDRKIHPFFVATQFHPEYKSRFLTPHPLFVAWVKAML